MVRSQQKPALYTLLTPSTAKLPVPEQPISPAHLVKLSSSRLALTEFTDQTPLFKFLKAEHAETMLRTGRVRIGTLYSFREEEQHGTARGDRLEGSTGALGVIDQLTIEAGKALPPFFAKFLSVPADRPISVKNWFVEVAANDSDYFVYSFAALPDPRLFVAFDCDTCVRITKPRSFFATLTDAISDRLLISDEPTASMKPVVYGDRRGYYNAAFDHPGPFVKPPRYSYQREVRLLWTPAAIPIEPFIVDVPAIRALCEVIGTVPEKPSGV